MTPFKYAREEIKAGRFPQMNIEALAGAYYLCDREWNLLPGGKAYASKAHAMHDRSKILDRATRGA